jgi:ZIP family zinc transporter
MQTLLFAAVASSALLLGAVVGMRYMPSKRALAALLAFAAGALTAALAFELFLKSFEEGGHVSSGLGLAGGAVTFVIVDLLLDRHMKRTGVGTGGLALLAGVMLDGIPENLALGTTLAAGEGSVALLAAIFASNFPEALVGARTMCENGRPRAFVIATWGTAAILLAAAIVGGASLLDGVEGASLSVILAFAGGAVLASLADTLFPKAYQDGGPLVALATTAGFAVAFILGTV